MRYIDPNLPRDIFGWRSPRLGLDMPIVRYGREGRPLLLFPTAAADFLENERFFLVKAVEEHIFAGRVQVFSIDSINKYAWMDRDLPVAIAARRHAAYASYVEEEVVPHVRRAVANPHARLIVSGASFGAFHAANVFFRRPDLFETLVGMAGFYDLGPDYLEGFMNDDVYFNNPMSFVENMNGDHLDRIRSRCDIHLITGQGAYEAPWASRRFSELLYRKGVPHNLDIWGHDVNHDWPWWRRMLDHYVGHRLS